MQDSAVGLTASTDLPACDGIYQHMAPHSQEQQWHCVMYLNVPNLPLFQQLGGELQQGYIMATSQRSYRRNHVILLCAARHVSVLMHSWDGSQSESLLSSNGYA